MAAVSLVQFPVTYLPLNTAVERALAKVPKEDLGRIYFHLWKVHGSHDSSDHNYGENAFQGRNGKSASDEDRLEAIRRYAEEEFTRIPEHDRSIVYHNLWSIHGKKDFYDYGEHAFHHRMGQSAELFDKIEAIRQYHCRASREPSLKALKAVPAPRWALEGVIYSIFVRNFSLKGDINSVTQKLKYLKALGVSVLWLMPLHPIGEKQRKGVVGSPYSIQDYYKIDPAYGTVRDLQNLVANAHKLGMKVIMDAVVNHTSWDSELLKKRPDFFLHDIFGRVKSPCSDWEDVAALDYSNSRVHVYIIDMLKHWIRECDIDGYRFDAAFMVPTRFWERAHKELNAFKHGSLLLGEIESPEALVNGFNMDYGWKFESALQDILINGADATATLRDVLSYELESYPQGAAHARFSDNHDKRRAISIYGEKGALAASALIFALPGVPLLYNGMEVGDATESCSDALFEKKPIFWESGKVRPEFLKFYQQVIALRNKHPALRDGEVQWEKNSEDVRIVTFSRKGRLDDFFIAINFSNRPFAGTVDFDLGGYKDVTPGRTDIVSETPKFTLKAWEFRYYLRG